MSLPLPSSDQPGDPARAAQPVRAGRPPDQVPSEPTPMGPLPGDLTAIGSPSAVLRSAPQPPQSVSVMAIVGFVCSLVALLPWFWIWIQVPGVLGVVCSWLGMRATAHHRRRGRGLAIAGLVVGSIAIAIAVLFTIYVYTSDDCVTDGFRIECTRDESGTPA